MIPHAGVRRAINFVAFQIVWFAVVMNAAAGRQLYGLVIAAAWLALHVLGTPGRRHELRLAAAVTALGVAVDQAPVALGVVEFDPSGRRIGLVPLWIAALWTTFATTLGWSLAWLQRRLAVAALLGATCGPLVYAGAARLGAVTLAVDRPWLTFGVLGAEWAIMMPLTLWLARRLGAPPPTIRRAG
jgi:hypothetical protein